MISVDDAVSLINSTIEPLPAEFLETSSALGRVLAEDVTSRLTHPPTDVSAMDGFAVRSKDVTEVPTTLRVAGESAAGVGFTGSLGDRESVRISTGAPVPLGSDSIVIKENARVHADGVTLLEKPVPGRWIRKAGLDFHKGQVLLKTGHMMTARDIGLAAAMNVPWITVFRKPRVAFLATGNEVVLPGTPLMPNQIVSSNSSAMAAYITALGGVPVNLGIARDTEGSLAATLQGIQGVDLLVTIGGASVGDHDLVQSVLASLGFHVLFRTVAMRPGKPVMFGQFGELPVLSLPGNPVSVGVATLVFLKPAMEVMLGVNQEGIGQPTARLGCNLGSNDQRQDYLRARLSRTSTGQLVATTFEPQDSSMLAAFSMADCLVVRPPYAVAATAGDKVDIILFEQTAAPL